MFTSHPYCLLLIMTMPGAFLPGEDRIVSNGLAAPSEWLWTRRADLPEPEGYKGMYAGVSGDWMILAGGSNFPQPRLPGTVKQLSDRIMVAPVRDHNDRPWSYSAARLTRALGEGGSVTTEWGVVCVGGLSNSGPVQDVFLLKCEPTTGEVVQVRLPDLPAKVSNAAVAQWEGRLYVAGGEGIDGLVHRFWSLDLKAALTDGSPPDWLEIAPWPGTARMGAALILLTDGTGQRLLHMHGGRTLRGARVVETDYAVESFAYDRGADHWEAVPAPPHPALLAGAVRLSESQFAFLGGSDGHSLDRIRELGDRYRIPNRIQVYDAVKNDWALRGEMPLGLAGASVIARDDDWIIAGGEPSPGLRTPLVYGLSVQTPETDLPVP